MVLQVLPPDVVRHFGLALVVTFCVSPLQSATLERLSLTDMIQKSTAIVRGAVTGSHAAQQGRIIYTHYSIQVSEQLKGAPQSAVDIVVPGGIANNIRQSFPGTPAFHAGENYVLFLWTGPSGLTQIIGLTQGIFALSTDASGNLVATRNASTEVMLDPGTGREVKDQTLVMNLSDLRSQIASTLGGSK
jgi:hypothetical protein